MKETNKYKHILTCLRDNKHMYLTKPFKTIDKESTS